MVEEFNGGNPLNARIRIDYSGLKPEVRFSYPDKKNQYRPNMFIFLFVIWFIINSPVFLLLTSLDVFAPESGAKDNYNFSNYTEYVNYFNENDLLNKSFERENKNYITKTKDSFVEQGWTNWKWLIYLAYFSLTPFLIYPLCKKKLNEIYPDYEAFLTSKKYRKFTKKDIEIDNKGNYYCEIPLFTNVLCDYKATKDFSKYLKFFEIREHKFYSYRKRKLKNKKKGRKVNEALWYAKFYFSEKPKDGFLEVVFK